MVAVLKLWKPKTIMRLEGDQPVTVATRSSIRPARLFMAWLPYLLLVVFVLAWGEPTIKPAHRPLDRQPAARRRCPTSADRR